MKVNFPTTSSVFVQQRITKFGNKQDKIGSNSDIENFKHALSNQDLWKRYYNDSDNSVSINAIMSDVPGYVITSDGSVWRGCTMSGEPAKKIIEKEPYLAEFVEIVEREEQTLNKINVLA